MKYILTLLALTIAGCNTVAPLPTAEKFTFLCITPFGPSIIENTDPNVKKYDETYVWFQPNPLGQIFRIPQSLCMRAYEK